MERMAALAERTGPEWRRKVTLTSRWETLTERCAPGTSRKEQLTERKAALTEGCAPGTSGSSPVHSGPSTCRSVSCELRSVS